VDNAEQNVRVWLDRNGCSVKSATIPEAFFRLEVRLPGGLNILIGRARERFEDVYVIAGLANEATTLKEVDSATKDQQERLADLIKLELARARVGYFGLVFPIAKQFSVVKNLRITDYLSEQDFMQGVWDVEAAANAIMAVYRLWIQEVVKPPEQALNTSPASLAIPPAPIRDLQYPIPSQE
jgi:hypothetical protein